MTHAHARTREHPSVRTLGEDLAGVLSCPRGPGWSMHGDTLFSHREEDGHRWAPGGRGSSCPSFSIPLPTRAFSPKSARPGGRLVGSGSAENPSPGDRVGAGHRGRPGCCWALRHMTQMRAGPIAMETGVQLCGQRFLPQPREMPVPPSGCTGPPGSPHRQWSGCPGQGPSYTARAGFPGAK